MPPSEQIDLACPQCGNTLFVAVVAMRVNEAGGTVHPPRGYQCTQCQTTMDMQTVLRQREITQLERELREKQARLAGMQPRATSVTDSTG